MENFVKSTKGYINSFRSTDDSKRKDTKQTLSNFSPTFVGDVYEKSVEVAPEEGYSNTTDNIYSSPVYKLNPEDAEAEHDTSEALEVTESSENAQPLTTSDSKTLTEKPSEETETTSSLNSASSSVASPSDEDSNEADRKDYRLLSNTKLNRDPSSSPRVSASSPGDLEANEPSEETGRRESVEVIEDCREDERRFIFYAQNAEGAKEDTEAHYLQLEDSRSLSQSESATPQGEAIQYASTETLAAFSFLQSTEKKDQSEQPSQVEASDSTELVANLSYTKSVQPTEAELGPSDEVEQRNTQDDEVCFPDLVALISEIETSFDEAEYKEDDSSSQDEGSYNTALNLPQSDTSSIREGVDQEADSEKNDEHRVLAQRPYESEEQTTNQSFKHPVAQRKSPSEDISDLELISEDQPEVFFEDQPTFCSSNVSKAHLQELESLARQVLKGTHESDSDLSVETSQESILEPTELVGSALESIESEQATEIVAEEGTTGTESDTKEETRSITEVAAVTESDSKGQTHSGEAAVELVVREELLADIDTNEDTKSEEEALAQEEVATETQPEGPLVAQDREVAAFTESDSDEQTQPEQPVVAEAQEFEPARTKEVASVTDPDTSEQTQPEEEVLAEAQEFEPARTKEVAAVTEPDSDEQTQPEEEVRAEAQEVEPAASEEVATVTDPDTSEQTQPEEEVLAEAQEVEPAATKEVAAVTEPDSDEQTQPEQPAVAEEEKVAAVCDPESNEHAQPEDPVVTEEPAPAEGNEVAAVPTTDSVEQTHSEEPTVIGIEEVASETLLEEQVLVQKEEVASVTEPVSNEQTQSEESAALQGEGIAAVTERNTKEEAQSAESKEPEVATVPEIISEIKSSITATVTKPLKEDNMHIRDVGFAEEKKDEEDLAQVSMEPMETSVPEASKSSLQLGTKETRPISPQKTEGRDDDRSETSDVVGLSSGKSGPSISGAHPGSVDDAIDVRRAKSEEKSLTPQRDRSIASQRSSQDNAVANQTRPRTPLRTKSPPRDRSKTPIQDRPELEKKESIPKKKLTEYIRKDLWNRKKPDLVLEAIQAVAEAAIQVESRSAIARAGGLLALIRAMEDHVNDVKIQIASCCALERLALDPENEIAIAEIGGVDAVLGAMMCHFKNAELHEAAWSTLWNLTCVNSAEEMTIDTAGGMQAIVSCMKQHINNPMVQKNACGALTNLCLHSEARLQALSDAGGFVAISSALQKHFKNMEVRKQASFALTSLLESHAGQYEADHGM